MKTSEINNSLVGKKVNGYFMEKNVTGTIIAIVNDYADNHPKRIAAGEPAKYLCTVGIRIKLDEAIKWAGFDWKEYEATESLETGRGNLRMVSII
jgi:hypothetical protein